MRPPVNIVASVRQRLLNRAREERIEFQRMLVRYAIERFLFRLSRHHACDRFVLKGAMLFITWPSAIARPTGDLDLLGHGSPDPKSIADLFIDICTINDNDGMSYDTATMRIEAVREDQDYNGARIMLMAMLGEARIPIQIDIGYGDVIHPTPTKINFPCLLEGMAPPRVLAYPAATVIAEKFEAMVRFGPANSRLKDFYDVWQISRIFDFERADLVEALSGTLRRRGAPFPISTPIALTAAFSEAPEKQAIWQAFLRRAAPDSELVTLTFVTEEIRRFLGPVLSDLGRPESAHGTWRASSGWTL